MEPLLAKKRVIKANVTRLENSVSVVQASESSIIQIHKLRVEQLASDTDCLLNDVSVVVKSDEEFAEYESELNNVYDRLVALRAKLMDFTVPVCDESTTCITPTPGTSRPSEVRLPKLQLPTFDGNLQKWLPFRDLFEAAVHNNCNLSGVEKLQYLKGSLQGEPSALLLSIPLTNANYTEAWELLTSRYQNTREIVNSIMKRMFSQSVMQQESAVNLRRLLDNTLECTRSLKVLGQPIEYWDTVLVFHTVEKLDSETRRQWELSLTTKETPTFQQLTEFMEHRARALAAAGTLKAKGSAVSNSAKSQTNKQAFVHHSVFQSQQASLCEKCEGNHAIQKCNEFLNATVHDRHSFVKSKPLCFNCLRPHHTCRDCKSPGRCRICHKQHHSLLHFAEPTAGEQQTVPVAVESTVSSHFSHESASSTVLLSTAVVHVRDMNGINRPVRALLDSASEASFITENCVQRLGLRKQSSQVFISGLASSRIGKCLGLVNLKFTPTFNSEDMFSVNALVLPSVTGMLPRNPVKVEDCWSHLSGLRLADPVFNIPGGVDILLGADIYPMLLHSGRCSGDSGSPVALETALGWILSGPIKASDSTSAVATFHVQCGLDSVLHRFWELEDVPIANMFTKEETLCERHFDRSHNRDDSGRFVVDLPFREDCESLGSSRNVAVKRLNQLEQRFKYQPDIKQQYGDFMTEYLTLGHMEVVPTNQLNKPCSEVYYIPHHPVMKESSSTTKLRVVFDASAKSSSGVSLNDQLMVGPKLQEDIAPILIRFRKHIIPLVADVAKMYRQIQVNHLQTDFQRIVWRTTPEEPIQEFRLLTVTYGTSCAPYIATKCLQQLAKDEETSFPIASPVLLKDFYVDDLMSGSETVADALELQDQLIQLMRKGGFVLRKWSSSAPELLNAIPEDMREPNMPLIIDEDRAVKTLGLQWHPRTDQFSFSVIQPPRRTVVTKRMLLSDLAKVFDPLGWLSPVTIKAKLLFQSLWRLDLAWDDPLPENIYNTWRNYCDELPSLQAIRIDRCILAPQPTMCQLTGFCDASEAAYAAVVYQRTSYSDGTVLVKLIAGKTKVAPVKQVSIPRLELCGALLLARLMTLAKDSLGLNQDQVLAWTDSTIVLAWLASTPKRWKTFVANRVAEIQELLPYQHWRHVNSEDNPADCASRGLTPAALPRQSLWWSGPTWLQEARLPYFNEESPDQFLLSGEERTVVTSAHTTVDMSLLVKWSSLRKLQHVTAWCMRFYTNCRAARERRVFTPLTASELNDALFRWVIIVQNDEFHAEIQCLQGGRPLPPKSSILSLNPFLDVNGVLRVGGRLHNAQLSHDQKHPALIPRHGKLTELIIIHEHQVNLHAGPQLLQAILRQRFWIVRGRDVIRYHIRKCITCHRHRSETANQLMGQLPAARVRPARPFLHCGVDYAGPFVLRNMKGRSRITYKGYVALFICFTTKAIHLELVSDLSTAAFIASLKRFISRRGRPHEMYSDCGTNFVGAARELKELLTLIKTPKHQHTVERHLADQGVTWHFNPPAAPHQGGLWEAGVKSMKYHLRRVVGNSTLNFEEMYTVLTQVEACLNSRPLTAISNDPNDFTFLTPGHFLTGDSLLSMPEPDLTSAKINRLSRWQLLQQLVQHFWHRWSTEYLSRLQQRPKWWTQQPNIQPGDMVLLKDERLPPMQWKIGRVTSTHPGSDGLVRSVTLRTSSGELRRPIVKLSRLPFNDH